MPSHVIREAACRKQTRNPFLKAGRLNLRSQGEGRKTFQAESARY